MYLKIERSVPENEIIEAPSMGIVCTFGLWVPETLCVTLAWERLKMIGNCVKWVPDFCEQILKLNAPS